MFSKLVALLLLASSEIKAQSTKEYIVDCGTGRAKKALSIFFTIEADRWALNNSIQASNNGQCLLGLTSSQANELREKRNIEFVNLSSSLTDVPFASPTQSQVVDEGCTDWDDYSPYNCSWLESADYSELSVFCDQFVATENPDLSSKLSNKYKQHCLNFLLDSKDDCKAVED